MADKQAKAETAKTAPKATNVSDLEGTVNTKTAANAAGLTELRLKTLAREGKVPSAQKDQRGFWRFDVKQVQAWAQDRPKRAGRSDGRRFYKVPLTPEEASSVQRAIEPTGQELEPLNKPKAKKPAAPATEPQGKPSK